MNIKNNTIQFDLPEETTTAEVIDKILETNGLKESDEDFFDKFFQNIETRTHIVKSTAITLKENKVSEEKLTEILQKHLETSEEVAKNIIRDIKLKLLPFAHNKFEDKPLINIESNESFKNIEKYPEPNKKINEENTLQKEPTLVVKKNNPDSYREPIE